MINIHEISFDERLKYNNALLEFEKLFEYPFGEDFFVIDHGLDYFKFFDNLGDPHFFIAEEDGQIIGISVSVLQELLVNKIGKVWYLCDLKIHPKYRGRFIVQKILKYAFFKYFEVSKKVYGVIMNGSNNRVLKFNQKLPYLNLKFQTTVEFYLLDNSKDESKNFIKNNEYQFLSYRGIKDLILKSSNNRLDFVHYTLKVQKEKPLTNNQTKFMFCCEKNSELSKYFKNIDLLPSSDATVVANFELDSWDFIKSSDI